MKLYKFSQGSTFENLKTFIYVTNEYGVPSVEFVDAFIDQFGKIILNGNFTVNQNQFQQLDGLWLDIVKECEHNKVEYRETYGSLFYSVLCQKAMIKIKDGWEQSDWNQLSEQDKLELLKQFILDFDKHIMDGIDMQEQLFFENTKELIETDSNGEEYIKIHMNEADRGLCTARLYKNSKTVIEIGSYIGGIAKSTMNNPTLYNNIIKARNGKVQNNIVTSEIECKSPSGAGQIYRGFTCNGWVSWYNEYGELIDNYREKSITNDTYSISKEEEDSAKVYKLITEAESKTDEQHQPEDLNNSEIKPLINVVFKTTLKLRKSPLILHNDTTEIEFYFPRTDNKTTEYEYVILKSDNSNLIGNKYKDINKLINDTGIDFYGLKYSKNLSVLDLIIK